MKFLPNINSVSLMKLQESRLLSVCNVAPCNFLAGSVLRVALVPAAMRTKELSLRSYSCFTSLFLAEITVLAACVGIHSRLLLRCQMS